MAWIASSNHKYKRNFGERIAMQIFDKDWADKKYLRPDEAQSMVNEILFSFVVLVATFILMWWAA